MRETRIGESGLDDDQRSVAGNFLEAVDRLLRKSAQASDTPLIGRVQSPVIPLLPLRVVGEYISSEDGKNSVLSYAGIEVSSDDQEVTTAFEVQRDLTDTNEFHVANGYPLAEDTNMQAGLQYVKEIEDYFDRLNRPIDAASETVPVFFANQNGHGNNRPMDMPLVEGLGQNIPDNGRNLITNEDELENFYSYKEAAAELGLALQTFYHYMQSGRLESYRSVFHGRIKYVRKSDVESFRQALINTEKTGRKPNAHRIFFASQEPSLQEANEVSPETADSENTEVAHSAQNRDVIMKPDKSSSASGGLTTDQQRSVAIYNAWMKSTARNPLQHVARVFKIGDSEVMRYINKVLDDPELEKYIK